MLTCTIAAHKVVTRTTRLSVVVKVHDIHRANPRFRFNPKASRFVFNWGNSHRLSFRNTMVKNAVIAMKAKTTFIIVL